MSKTQLLVKEGPENGQVKLPQLSANPGTLPSISASITCPTVIGEFCLNSRRELQLGRADVRYVVENFLSVGDRETKVRMDLNKNFDTGKVNDNKDELISNMLRWVKLCSRRGSDLKKVLHEAQFLTWRGVLTRIGISPYDITSNGDGVKVACCKFKGVIFICEYQTESKISNEAKMSDYQRRATYWGRKFEQFVTSETLKGQPDTSVPINQSTEFCAMFKTDVKGSNNETFRVVYGAEIDCINPKGDYLELKTQYNQIGHGNYFDSKALKWFLQSYLANIKTLVVGIRDGNGIINKVQLLPVDQLPKDYSKNWKRDVCLSFIHSFLKTISQLMATLPEGSIVVADRSPRGYQFVFKLVEQGNTSYNFLSDEFKQHFC